MRVDGEAFRKAREKLRLEAGGGRGEPGAPAVGTQEWLAARSGVSVRSVQTLESQGIASKQTLLCVAQVLGLDPEELIMGYGEEFISCSAEKYFDFRPAASPREDSVFEESVMMMTLDPLTISVSPKAARKGRGFRLKSCAARLKNLDISLKTIYVVDISPSAKTWLGVRSEFHGLSLDPGEDWIAPLMFGQDGGRRLLWREFVEYVESCPDNHIQFDVSLEFERFRKALCVSFSVKDAQNYASRSRQRRKSDWPWYLQPAAQIWR